MKSRPGLAVACLAAVACVAATPRPRDVREDAAANAASHTPALPALPSSGWELIVTSNTQARIGDVSIGAGNFRLEDVDGAAPNAATRPWSCGLWISTGGDPARNRFLRVRGGQRFDVDDLRFEVREVRPRDVVLVAFRRDGGDTP